MGFFSRFSLVRAYRDLRFFLSLRQPYELGFLVLAMGVTGFFIYAFASDRSIEPPYRRNIVYVEQWRADRTDAEIIAQQKIDEPIRQKALAEQRKADDERRASFRRLDKKLERWGALTDTPGDVRWMAAALALGERTRGRTAPNPNVGCVIVRHDRVVGRGWTQAGGRPHAEAMALAEAGPRAIGATCYTTLEPCAHRSQRGPACSGLLVEAGIARVVAAIGDPDPRTNGDGFARLRAAGMIVASGVAADAARRSMAGFLTRRTLGRPHVTLKLATSLDGCIALASGESRWITGPESRAHAHLERSRHEAILVGRGTLDADAPRLDVRLAGLEGHSPRRILMSAQPESGWEHIDKPALIAGLHGVDHLLVEGGARTAAAFLAEDLVDRLLLYRAPILIGGGVASLADIGMTALAEAHKRWRTVDRRMLGSDTLEVYERVRPGGGRKAKD